MRQWGSRATMFSSAARSSEDLQYRFLYTRPWHDLPIDLLNLIVSRLKTTVDVAHFGRVCTTWNAASYFNKRHPSKQLPWLLLSERDMGFDTYCQSYTNPDTGFRRFLLFPKEKQLSFKLTASCRRRCVGSGAGWLIMLSISGQIMMLCPLNGTRIPLPPQSTINFREELYTEEDWLMEKFKVYISKIIIGKDNSGCVVALAIAGVDRKLAIARPRDHKWTSIKCKWSPISDAIFHDGRIYAVNRKGMLMTCNVTGQAERIANPSKYWLHSRHRWYIVSSTTGSLLLVARQYTWRYNWRWVTKRFTIFEWLPEEGHCLPTMNLGDQALFLGFNTSTSFKASDIPGCEANCVYFTDDYIDQYRHIKDIGGGHDTGKYCLLGDSLQRNYVGDSLYSPPLWYVPRLP